MASPVESKGALDYLIALVPIFISAAVAYIAWAQYITNKSKLKLDLYNRRFAVFDKTLTYYLAYMAAERSPVVIKNASVEFVWAYRESIYLFGANSSVYEALTKIKDTLGFFVQFDEKFNSELYNKDEYTAWSELKGSQPDLPKLMESLESSLLPWLDFHEVEKLNPLD